MHKTQKQIGAGDFDIQRFRFSAACGLVFARMDGENTDAVIGQYIAPVQIYKKSVF